MHSTKAGYTLLELLVVLVIISIVASMTMLRIGHNEQREIKAFANSVAQTLTLAEEQALLQPTTLGLIVTPASFGFYSDQSHTTTPDWQALEDHELGHHLIPDNIEISIHQGQETLPLSPEKPLLQKRNPALVISSNGTLTPFVLLIGKKHKKPLYQLSATEDGTITTEVYKG